MSAYDNLLGLPYVEGKTDCYTIIRRYYQEFWGLRLPNFARPTRFWEDPTMNLYVDLYRSFGFKLVMDEALRVGDGLIMPLATSVNTHAAVVVEDNQILHHPPGRLSSFDPLYPRWFTRANLVLRHPEVTRQQNEQKETVQLHEVVDARIFKDPAFQKIVAKAMEAEHGDLRGDQPQDAGPGDEEPRS